MPLFLAVHTVEAVTANFPLYMVLLLDRIKHKNIPEGLKVRVVLPTTGLQSTSVWEAASADVLQEWLDQNLSQDCRTSVYEVQEDLTYGLGFELARVRAGETVVARSKQTLEKVSQVAQRAVSGVTAKGRENDGTEGEHHATPAPTTQQAGDGTQANIMENVNLYRQRASAAFSWVGSRVKASIATYAAPPGSSDNASMSASANAVPVSTTPKSTSYTSDRYAVSENVEQSTATELSNMNLSYSKANP